MTISQTKSVEKIRDEYSFKEQTKTSFDDLIALNKKVKLPAKIFAYTFGTAGTLLLGTGMCSAMEAITLSMPLGIAIGVVGIAMITVNYLLYKVILNSRKRKYADEIINISNSLLKE